MFIEDSEMFHTHIGILPLRLLFDTSNDLKCFNWPIKWREFEEIRVELRSNISKGLLQLFGDYLHSLQDQESSGVID